MTTQDLQTRQAQLMAEAVESAWNFQRLITTGDPKYKTKLTMLNPDGIIKKKATVKPAGNITPQPEEPKDTNKTKETTGNIKITEIKPSHIKTFMERDMPEDSDTDSICSTTPSEDTPEEDEEPKDTKETPNTPKDTKDTPEEKTAKMIGYKSTTQSAMEAVFRNNAKNKIGFTDYNKYGKRGHKLTTISDIFCDNFLFKCLVLERNIVKGSKKCIETGALNSIIHNMLKSNKIEHARVKAIDIKPDDSKNPVKPFHIAYYKTINAHQNPTADDKYKWQVFKIATADEPLNHILNFFQGDRLETLAKSNIYLVDIDFTQDLKGNFDKQLTIKHLQDNHEFKLIGDHGDLENGDRIINDNDKSVGRNCLTFLQKEGGKLTRWKVYNKFVQSLESSSVRSSVGTHIVDWVNNPEDRLKKTIPQCINEGLTRLEITYTEHIPDLTVINADIKTLLDYIPPSIAFKSPIKDQWRALCEKLEHTLYVYNKEENKLIMGWWINELTGKIGGVYLNNCCPIKLHWLLTASSLGQNLPIDLVEVNFERGRRTLKDGTKAKREIITNIKTEIKSYVRVGYDKTHLIHKNSVYYQIPKHTINISDYGLTETPTFKPFLCNKRFNIKSAPLAELRPIKPMVLNALSPSETVKHIVNMAFKMAIEREYMELKKQRAEEVRLILELQELEDRKKLLQEKYKTALKQKQNMTNLEDGTNLSIEALALSKNKWGTTYILIGYIGDSEDLTAFYADPYNKKVLPGIIEQSEGKLKAQDGIISYNGHYILTMEKVRNAFYNGNAYPYTKVKYNRNLPQPPEEVIRQQIKAVKNTNKIIDLSKQEIPPINKLHKIKELDIGNAYKIIGITTKQFRGVNKYILKLDGLDGLYFANYWLSVELDKLTKPKAKKPTLLKMAVSFILDAKRSTPSKNKEHKIKMV